MYPVYKMEDFHCDLGKAEYFWSEKRRNVTLEKAFVAAIPAPQGWGHSSVLVNLFETEPSLEDYQQCVAGKTQTQCLCQHFAMGRRKKSIFGENGCKS